MWKGSLIGCWLKGKARWHATVANVDGTQSLVVRIREAADAVAIAEIRNVEVRSGWFWSSVEIQTEDEIISLPGTPEEIANDLVQRLDKLVLSHLALQLKRLDPLLERSRKTVDAFLAQDRYIRHSDVEAFGVGLRNGGELAEMLFEILHHPYAERLPHWEQFTELGQRIKESVAPGSRAIRQRNEAFVRQELLTHSAFFDQVEKTPLTDEQRRAAVIFEDRNLLVAAAGSGKSSTLIGKAGYAIKRGLFQPSEVVALAFNRKAAAELNERVRNRLGTALGGRRLRANTFHALGAMIVRGVAKQNGKRLRVAKKESEKPRLEKVVASLRVDSAFLADWVLFVSLCREPLPVEDAFQSFDDYERYIERKRQARRNGDAADFKALSGDVVRSSEELAIANWLYLNGVPFEYEKRFEPVPPEWDKYEPDFYFPEIGVWYEHFGLDARGQAPRFFKPGYATQATKKRQWLTEHVPSKWFETRSHQYRDGTLFQALEAALLRHGQELRRRSPEDVLARVRSLRQTDVLDLILQTLHLVKGNGYSQDEVRQRAAAVADGYRTQQFLRVFWPLYNGYNERLLHEQAIDFDDMILRAAEHLERGEYQSPYKLVMVDEFQDMSPGRARLVKALLAQHKDSVLFGVGDDWQAINGFAGSDLRLFMEFKKVFGPTSENLLTKTFRSPQGISNVAAAFIQKNKQGQKAKRVDSELDRRVDGVVDLHDVQQDVDMPAAVNEQLSKLVAELLSKHDGLVSEQRTTVYLLSRYSIENTAGLSEDWLRRTQFQFANLLDIEFMTVHKSKGLEADYVLVLGLNGGRGMAFPSSRRNDPLLDMLLAKHDNLFPFAEERRLFYVALTRAKKKCIVLFRRLGVSPFVLELMSPENSQSITYRSGPLPKRCGTCGEGFLVPRPSKFDKPFLGCTRYSPNGGCRHQEAI
ncbi:DNA helicase II [Ralstonia solanacearum]|nr:DNA helicase II [Ralstonia solanacearum]NKF94178.1 DNA helicase II [Ralstonia solanacearum]NKG09542.1 DNA helicase II [Ralstonia solanacearum]